MTRLVVQACIAGLLAAIAMGCESRTPATAGGIEHSDAIDVGRGLKPQRGPVMANTANGPPVEFEPAEMAFGILPPGSAAQGTTRIWNVGTEPLRIVRSITSCGCTAAEDLAGRVIKPGSFTEFTTVMNMKSGLGEKMEKITVFFEDGSYVVQLYKAEVALPVRAVPPHLAASVNRDGRWVQTASGEVEVTATDGVPFRILAAHGAPPRFIGYDPATDPPRTTYRVIWDLSRFQGQIPWYWVLETDRPDCPVVDLRVRHSSTLPPKPPGRPWVPKGFRSLVGEVRNGKPFEIIALIEYGGGAIPEPQRADVLPGRLSEELVEIQVEGSSLRFRVRVTPNDSPSGLFYEQITLYASGFSTQHYLIGRIVE